MDRKTTTILVAAGGLVAAAVALGRTREGAVAPPPTGGGDIIGQTAADPCRPAGAPQASAEASFGSGTLKAALSAGKIMTGTDGTLYMGVGLDVAEVVGTERTPVNMAIVIDHSGSMAGEALAQARAAARGLVERLDAGDRVALIQYDDDAQVLVASRAMDADGKRRMLAAIDGIDDDGGTNIHDGLALGIAEARRSAGDQRINRVVLLSDGQATSGNTDPSAIAGIAADAANQGIRVTSIGLGISYNEDLMEAIAENGRGQYYYVKDGSALQAVFSGELRDMQATVATGAELRIEPACGGVEVVDVTGWRTTRDGAALVVPMADLFGGEERKLMVKLRAPTRLRGAANLARATLRFTDKATGKPRTAEVALAIEVTDDAQAIRESVNPEIMAKVEQVEAAQVIREASAAYEKGDVQAARGMLARKKAETAQRTKDYDLAPAAVAPAMAEMDALDQGAGQYAPGSGEGKMMLKASKAKARDMAKKAAP